MPRCLHYATAFTTALLLAACSSGGPTPAPATQAATARPTVGDEVKAAVDNHLDVLFPDGSDQLTAEGNHQLDIAARLYRDVRPVKMFAIGYSDPSGGEYANLLLSARRARAVKDAMVARGIPADRVMLQALGQSELADSNQPMAPDNRRVVVKWQIL